LILTTVFAAVICTAPAVHDGDSIRCGKERIRLIGIDAPELRGSPRCEQKRTGRNPSWCDYQLGDRSRDALREFLRSGTVSFERKSLDRYRRTLARVTVNGRDAGEYLISRGFARPWR
jgi:micrococcal nuclease